jgi:hypothetical protein
MSIKAWWNVDSSLELSVPRLPGVYCFDAEFLIFYLASIGRANYLVEIYNPVGLYCFAMMRGANQLKQRRIHPGTSIENHRKVACRKRSHSCSLAVQDAEQC